jgi:malate dehydrogenase
MDEVAILGAGDLGGALAYVLARRDIVRRIRLIDDSGEVAAGKALDIMQASPIESFSTYVSGSPDLTTAAGASILVIADRAGSAKPAAAGSGSQVSAVAGEWQGEPGVRLLVQLSQVARNRVVVCAGAEQRELVERGVSELGFDRERLCGSAPEALAAAIRALVALEAGGSAKDVGLTVLGVPPNHVVVPWEEATIGGRSATRVLDEPARRRLAARVAPLWPPGPYALANAAADVVAGLAGASRRTVSCFMAPASRGRARTIALPVRLGPSGTASIDVPALSVQAQVALDNAMLL